jgi:hypothetical protein
MMVRGEAMTKHRAPMEIFGFLLGDWNLEYRIPKSFMSEADTGMGSGTFRRFLHKSALKLGVRAMSYLVLDYMEQQGTR